MSTKLSGEALNETMMILDKLHNSVTTARNALMSYQNDKVLVEIYRVLAEAANYGNQFKERLPHIVVPDTKGK